MGIIVCAKNEFERREELFEDLSNASRINYYNPESSKIFNDILDNVKDDKLLQSEGELNYLITKLVRTWVNKKPIRKYDVWDILGSVKDYWYAIQVVPYEKKKIKENGDL